MHITFILHKGNVILKQFVMPEYFFYQENEFVVEVFVNAYDEVNKKI